MSDTSLKSRRALARFTGWLRPFANLARQGSLHSGCLARKYLDLRRDENVLV